MIPPCPRCGKNDFARTRDRDRHLNRKHPCPIRIQVPEPALQEVEREPGERELVSILASQNTDIKWYSAIRRFLFWKKQGEDIEFYDGTTQWIGSEKDFRDLSRDWFLIKANLNETLQEANIRYNEEANIISSRSGGKIDLRKTGTYAISSLRFFQDVTKAPKKAKDLSHKEDYWIKSAYTGSLVWAESYEGFATEFDFNEYYPYILAHDEAYWPIGPGEFKTLKQVADLEYGIYRAFIEGQPADYKCSRTFRFNSAGYYTHYDLALAQNLGLRIDLSSEGPNALIFEKSQLMSGREIFLQWAKYLTTIKHEGGQAGNVAKQMLVSLWGRLYSDGQRPGPHRRMAPFISARGRKIVSEKIVLLGDRIKRIDTDGFIISGKISDQSIGKQAGELKIVNSGIVKIENVMSLKWIDLEEIIPATSLISEKSTVRYRGFPNEILEKIFHYYSKKKTQKCINFY